MFKKLVNIYRSRGMSELTGRIFSYCYKTAVRPLLPSEGYLVFGQVLVGLSRKVGDRAMFSKLYFPAGDQPDYELGLVTALKKNIRPGDTVVVVGGGLGVTAVTAALATTSKGSVTCYEGDLAGVRAVRKAASLNGVEAYLSVVHAVVGEAIGVYGSEHARTVVRPDELPVCDVLELDCEGAETKILRDMTINPRVIVVETHGFLGSSTEEVRRLLESRGYSVDDLGWAEPLRLADCIDWDIRVLVASKHSGAAG